MTTRFVTADAGMTLVELLVVLAILALLGGLLSAGLHTAASSWQHVASRNAGREELDAIQSQLRALLAQIYPANVNSGSRTLVQFDGQSDRLNFLAPLPRRYGAEDIVSYALRFSSDGRLRLTWRLDRSSGDLAPGGDESIADGGPGSFEYYGHIDGAGEARWFSSWHKQRRLPSLIRVMFTWRGNQQELVVAPLVTGAFCSVSSSDETCSN